MKRIVLVILCICFSSLVFSQKDTIIVAGDFNYPPFSFIDENGNAAGYDIDIMNEIAKITGLKIKFRLGNWDSTLIQIQEGKVDVIMGIVYSAEREKIYDFSFPLHTEYYGIFAKKTTKINDINDLERKKPAILNGDISNTLFFKPMGLYKNYLITESFPGAFSAINSDKCDYVVAPYSIGMEVIVENDYTDIEVKGDPIIPSVFCYAVKENDYELLAWINQGIELLSRNGELDKIYKKWVRYQRDEKPYKKFFYYTLIGLLVFTVIIVILFLFGYSLKRQVKKKTIEIKKSETIYHNVFNAVDEGLILLDDSQIIIEANQKAYDLFNYKNKLIGESIFSVVREENKEKIIDIFDLIKSNKSFYKKDIERIIDNKKQYITIAGFKIAIDDKNNYLIVIHDTTREQINLLALQKAKKIADSANNAKSTFLSTISHEIRTPLFAVIGYTELLSKTSLSGKQTDYTEKIEMSGKLLLNLVNNILDLTKMEAEKFELYPEPFSINELVEEICEIESIKATEKKLKLSTKIGDDVPDFLTGDKIHLSRILLNILNNAIKYTDKGEISIMVNVENLDELSEKEAVNIIFSIKDTGIGMSADSQKKLFMPFEQVQHPKGKKYGGTGLGLALAKQLVDLMNGHIGVESTPGEGSVFNISIPLKICHNPILNEKVEIPEETDNEKVEVLLVEDNNFNAEILINQLSDAGFEVTHAGSGFKAIEILKTKTFQLILMDIEMPEMDGFATLREIIKLKLTDAPVIALSAHNLSSEKEKAINAGMLDYLHKPISTKELRKSILKYRKEKTIITSRTPEAINIRVGLEIFENNHERYRRALVRFKNHFEASPQKLQEFFENNTVLLKDHAHNLKSAAKTIGAIQLSEIAAKCETVLRNRPNDFSNIDLKELRNELIRVLEELKRYDQSANIIDIT